MTRIGEEVKPKPNPMLDWVRSNNPETVTQIGWVNNRKSKLATQILDPLGIWVFAGLDREFVLFGFETVN